MTNNVSCYENSHYSVRVNDEGKGYSVINKTYNVTEFEAISLPECIFAAENLNVVLVHKTYEWVNKRAEAQAAEDSKSSAMANGLKLIN